MTSIAPDLDHLPARAKPAAPLQVRIAVAERFADCFVGLLAAAFEAIVIAALWQNGMASFAAIISVHIATVVLLWGWLVYRAAHAVDVSGPQLLLLATVATGPVGAVIAAVTALVPARPAADQTLLDAWYDRISQASGVDQITELADGIAIGRTIDLAKPSGPSFVDVMRGSDIRAQQTVLGLIARRFQPEYVPALVLALKNREPIIRVQAAAVATRIRPNLVAMVTAAAATGSAVAPGRAAATEGTRLVARRHVELALQSGLLDSADEAKAQRVLRALDASPADHVANFTLRGGSVRATRGIARLTPAVRRQIEAQLLAGGQFSDLRRLRSISRIGAGQLYRFRRMPRPDPAVATATATASVAS